MVLEHIGTYWNGNLGLGPESNILTLKADLVSDKIQRTSSETCDFEIQKFWQFDFPICVSRTLKKGSVLLISVDSRTLKKGFVHLCSSPSRLNGKSGEVLSWSGTRGSLEVLSRKCRARRSKESGLNWTLDTDSDRLPLLMVSLSLAPVLCVQTQTLSTPLLYVSWPQSPSLSKPWLSSLPQAPIETQMIAAACSSRTSLKLFATSMFPMKRSLHLDSISIKYIKGRNNGFINRYMPPQVWRWGAGLHSKCRKTTDSTAKFAVRASWQLNTIRGPTTQWLITWNVSLLFL